MNVLIIVLGCHVAYLLNDRIQTAVQLTTTLDNENIVWGFSGGIKNKMADTVSEAEKMKKSLQTTFRSSTVPSPSGTISWTRNPPILQRTSPCSAEFWNKNPTSIRTYTWSHRISTLIGQSASPTES